MGSIDMGTRARERGILGELGWAEHKEDFRCFGVLRTPEELLCVPEWLKTDGDIHPFELALEMVENLKSAQPTELLAVPSLDSLALRYRVCTIQAVWKTPKKVQLDLNIGGDLVERLSTGLQPGGRRRAFAAVFAGMLILASERRGNEVMKTGLATIL